MSKINNTILLSFCFLGMATLFLVMHQSMEVDWIKIAGFVSLGLAAFFIGSFIYIIMKRRRYRKSN